MNVEFDQSYFEWLYDQISTHRKRRIELNYFKLMQLIFHKEFVWLIPNDDNRANDGRDLRDEFLEWLGVEDVVDIDWYEQGCSMLEMLIGLARRYSFETNLPYRVCFWEMLDNLGLHAFNDSVDISEDVVNNILDTAIWRLYEPNGHGGIFPLQDPEFDQTEVELIYQLDAYILEKNRV